MDSDQYRCLAARDRVEPGASPVVDQSTPAGALIVIYSIAGLCMAATVAVVTGVGNDSAVQTPIKVDDWSQADQARRVSGSADAHVE